MLLCALFIIFCRSRFQLIVLDQVPLPIPYLRLLTRAKILFYCHYPDKLLCVNRKNCFKRCYRYIIDTIEEHTMAMAHAILVNSKFTRGVFYNSFKIMGNKKRSCCCLCRAPKASVLYPSLERSGFDLPDSALPSLTETLELSIEQQQLLSSGKLKLILTLNRYERKKNLNLAITAYSEFLKKVPPETGKSTLLIVAGGYDTQVPENVQHYAELIELAVIRGIPKSQIKFLRSISNEARTLILKKSQILLYTPANEHFGIVPLEGMYNKAVVLACNSGGPLETVVDGETGILLNPESEEWANSLQKLIEDEKKCKEMGENGRKRVIDRFTNEAFADELDGIVGNLIRS